MVYVLRQLKHKRVDVREKYFDVINLSIWNEFDGKSYTQFKVYSYFIGL